MTEANDVGAWLKQRQASESAGGTWPLKHEAAEALRRILDALPRSSADAETLEGVIPLLQEAAERLTGHDPAEDARQGGSHIAGMADFIYVSPIVGFANAIASPFQFWIDEEERIARGEGSFRKAHEGGPGIVHGGILAATVDELLGMATTFSGQPGLTGRLTMHYHRPTPIEEPLQLTARLDRQEGRRLHMSCDVHHGEVRTASADAVFVVVSGDKFADLDAKRRAKSEDR